MRNALAIVAVAVFAAAAFVLGAQAGAPESADGAATVRLDIRYDVGEATTKTATLTCRGSRNRATGFLRRRDARRLCRVARDLRGFLADPPPHEVCTEQWGGPDRARVTGRIGDDRIDRRLARNDGCEIGDWDTAQPLLPKPKGAGAP